MHFALAQEMRRGQFVDQVPAAEASIAATAAKMKKKSKLRYRPTAPGLAGVGTTSGLGSDGGAGHAVQGGFGVSLSLTHPKGQGKCPSSTMAPARVKSVGASSAAKD